MKKKIISRIVLGICLIVLTGCGTGRETREEQMRLRSQGMEQARSGAYAEAVASYDKALELAGMRAGALELDIAAYKASAQYYAGDTQKAIDTCSAILDLKKSQEIYMTRGILYRQTGEIQKANEDFAAAVEMTSKKDTLMLGRLSYYMEDYANAKTYLDSAAKSGEPEAVYWQAELYWQMGNQDYAITLYQNYLAGEKAEHQAAYAKVASWQMEQGDYDAALATLQSGIAKGEGESLQELLGYEIAVYEQKGDFETAKLKMEAYLEQYPEDGKAQREWVFLQTR